MSRFPPVIVGGWQLSAGHRSNPRSADELFREFTAIADAGATAFDCADIYTGVEEFLGEFRRRYANTRGTEAAEALRFHTKYVPDYDALGSMGRADVEAIIDRSRERLGLERLHLVQFAWWDYAVDRWVEVAEHLNALREDGRVETLGATNFSTEALERMLEAGVPIEAHQVQYSALDHRPEGGADPSDVGVSMVESAEKRGFDLLCYGSLAGGFLSDRYLGAPPPEPPLPNRSLVKYRLIIDEYGGWERFQALLEVLRGVADEHDVSIAQVALAYTLTRPRVGGVIVGASRSERIVEALRAGELRLSETEVSAIRAMAAQGPGPAGPVFGLERDKDGPHGRIMKYNLNRA